MGPISEEKAAGASGLSLTFNVNGSDGTSDSSNKNRKSSAGDGRRSSRDLLRHDLLDVGSTKSPARRGSGSPFLGSRISVPDGREYKYWMMVTWTPHVGLYSVQ